MKTLTRLCLVFVMVAVASTMVYAGRPQCSPPFTPGPRICFTEVAPYGYDVMVALAGSEDNYMTEGTTAIYLFASNDFYKGSSRIQVGAPAVKRRMKGLSDNGFSESSRA